jgi:hypothetical protein
MEMALHTFWLVVVIVVFVLVMAGTSWMRSKNGPLKKYRRDYREEHPEDDRRF